MLKYNILQIVVLATLLVLAACGQAPPQPQPTIIYGPPPTEPAPEIVLGENAILTGYGEFPRMHFIAPDSVGVPAALYQVDKDTATKVLIFNGDSETSRVTSKLSPDGKHIVVLFLDYLELIDIEDANVSHLVEIDEDLQPDSGETGYQIITSFLWIDERRVLYSKVTIPGHEVLWNMPEDEGPLPIQGEIWQIALDSMDQRLLMTAPIYRLLGVSEDRNTFFVSGLVEGDWRLEDLYTLDAASGEMKSIWGAEAKPGRFPYGLESATLPDGSLRLFIAYSDQSPGTTVFEEIPDLWMIDPQTGNRQVVWVGDQHEWTKGLYLPQSIAWSSASMNEFLYKLGDQLWQVNIQSGEETFLGEFAGIIVSWLDEGILTWSWRTNENNSEFLRLLDLAGNVLGEIKFFEQPSYY